MFIIRLDRAVDIGRVDAAIGTNRHGGEHDAAKNRRTASFIDKHMVINTGEDFLTTLAMRHHRTEIPLRTTRHQKRGFLAKQCGRLVLQRIDRWIIAIDIITNFGRHHRSTHAFGWPGHRIAAHVDTGWLV